MDKTLRTKKAFSLIELLAALMIASMIIIATVAVYHRGRSALFAVDQRLNENSFSKEVLQKITEDIDEIVMDDVDLEFKLESKLSKATRISRLTISSFIYDNDGKKSEYKKVIWQSEYDPETELITLYRARGGFALEDVVLDTQRKDSPDRLLFVPVSQDITYFDLVVISNENELEKWSSDKLPTAVVAKVSFAQPEESETGDYEVPESKIDVRTVSLTRRQMLKFKFVATSTESEDVEEDEDEDKEDDEKTQDEQSVQEDDNTENDQQSAKDKVEDSVNQSKERIKK